MKNNKICKNRDFPGLGGASDTFRTGRRNEKDSKMLACDITVQRGKQAREIEKRRRGGSV